MLNRILVTAVAAFAAALLCHADLADAARMGGGRSLGAQRPSVTPMTPAPATRAPGMATPAPAAPAAAPRPAGASRWLAPLAGIAAGLGIAALLSHFGLSEAVGSFLLLGLLVFAAIFLVRLIFARRGGQSATVPRYVEPSAPMQDQRAQFPTSSRFEPVMPASPPAGATFGSEWGGRAPAAQSATPRWPPGFEPGPFLEQAKRQFTALQAAYDRGDRTLLADVTTPEMFAELSRDLDQRGTQVATEVVRLDPEILEVTTEGDRHWASVRFSGVLREDGAVIAKPFEEVWNLVKPVDGSSGWLLAGIQQPAHATT